MIVLNGLVLPHAESGRLSGTWNQLQHVEIQHNYSIFFCLVRDSYVCLFCYCGLSKILYGSLGASWKIKSWPGYNVLRESQPLL